MNAKDAKKIADRFNELGHRDAYLTQVHVEIVHAAKQGDYEVEIQDHSLLMQSVVDSLKADGFRVFPGGIIAWRD